MLFKPDKIILLEIIQLHDSGVMFDQGAHSDYMTVRDRETKQDAQLSQRDRISELSQLTVQILDTLHFSAPPGGLGTTYDVDLGLIGKHVVDFLLVLTELFSLGVMAEGYE